MDPRTVGALMDFVMRAARHADLVESEWGSPSDGLHFDSWFDGVSLDPDVVYEGLDLIAAMLCAERRVLDDDALSDAIAQVLTCYDDQDVFSPAIRDEMHSRVFHAVRAVLRGADPRAALLADLEALVRRWNMQAGTLASSPFEQCADELAAEVKKHREVD